MFPVTRLFESEQAARDAVEKLVAGEIPRRAITVINPPDASAEASVDAAIDASAEASVDAAIEAGFAMRGHRRALKEALSKGRSIVCVNPEYGMGRFVEVTLNRSGAVDSDTIPDYIPSDPAPLSNAFGIPVLTEGKSHVKLFDFKKTSSFGFGLLSKRATPLSSMFGMKVLSSSKGAKGTSIESMSGTAAPFSSSVGLKLLTSGRGSRAKGSSVERMSGNAAPFSSFLGLRVLSRRK